MQNLWAPWRMDYIQSLDSSKPTPAPTGPTPCFLCDAGKDPDHTPEADGRLVLLNSEYGCILLNRYPYTNGHLLISPKEHIADLTDLSAAQRAGLIELVALAEETLRAAVNPQGINLGVNLGRCAGAGVPGHLHFHAVPRWNGDVNFMQVTAHVRVIPQSLQASFAQLSKAMDLIRSKL